MAAPDIITDEELHSLTQAILRRYGIDFTCYEPVSLKRRIIRAVSVLKLGTVHNLWIRLLRDRDFIYPFVDEVAVGLTSMFRDPILWQTLRREALYAIPKKREIKVWHAGCSTGEEVYSMGIVLQEMGIQPQVKAVASDMSNAAISKAQKGTYHSLKIAEYEKNYSEYNRMGVFRKYFSAVDDQAKMHTSLIKHVNFRQHNLISDAIEDDYDIIFCRNVMIYFDQVAKLKLLEQFFNHLNPGGLLIIGFYDALVPLLDKNKFFYLSLNAKIFQKM
ncbi:protein-glutamate O-methyltransferase CheR [Catalinimonas sp. 4WD22]|uniref:CheR family methyltransferase n=1 Tax=Catalinimonas locisalis TaxID=3133978 RepID=UPI0031017220